MNISILITTYNAEKFVVETLDSILQQTFRAYEIVIVDDGSTDSTREILHQYQKAHPNGVIKLYNIDHLGRGYALDYAVKKARYDWVAIVDSDDLWHAQKLFLQVKYIQKFNLSFLATDAKLFESSQDIDMHKLLSLEEEKAKLKFISVSSLLFRNYVCHSSVVFKKELANYDVSRIRQLDYELWLRLLTRGEKIVFLDEKLAFHRLHEGQNFEAKNRLRYVFGSLKLQFVYSLKNKKIDYMFLCFFKFIYYAIATKKFKKFIHASKFLELRSSEKK